MAEPVTPQPCPIFLINLDGSDARLQAAEAQFRGAGIAFTRLSAVDGRGRPLASFPEYDAATTRRDHGRDMTSGEVGCYLSHVAAAQAVLDSGAPAGLVLEDDFAAQPGAWTVLEALLARLAEGAAPGWEMVNLTRAPKLVITPLGPLTIAGGAPELYRAHYFPVLATAILWSRAGAERFLREAARPQGPVDHVFRRMMCESGDGLALKPAPFGVTGAESDIIAASRLAPQKRTLLGAPQWTELRRQVRCLWQALRTKRRKI